MPYTPISAALLEQTVAARALTQLNRASFYPRTAIVGYEPGAFERGEEVSIRRPKRRRAQDVDPRGAGLTITEGSFFSAKVTLERLWGDGFPIYGNDPAQSLQRYVTDTANQMASSISEPNDEYMYDCFRTWSATTGAVEIGAHPPFAIVASVGDDNDFAEFDNNALRNAGTVLDKANVPAGGRFCGLSSTAKGAFLGDAVVVTGFASALNLGSGQLIQTGLPNNQFVERYGFQVGGTNTVEGQAGVSILTNGNVTAPIASVAANTLYTYADESVTTYIGAVNITLDGTGTSLSSSVGVGQIVKISVTSGGAVVGFGVVLRLNTTTATAPVVTLVPYTPSGTKLVAADLTSSMSLSVPTIPSVNTAHHQEGLLMATRLLREPSPNSGARAISIVSPDTNLLMQVFTGQYNIARVSEQQAYYMLCGSRFSDARKGCLILSK